LKTEQQRIPDLVADIEARLCTRDDNGNEDQFAGILRTVVQLAEDNATRGDLKIINRALQELRHAFKVFTPYRHMRKVSIFGSTRVQENTPYYDLARDTARSIAQAGFMIITGAGPGIMQAGHEGAGREKSFGVNIRLRSLQDANRFIRNDTKLMNFHFFFSRKLTFVKESDAVVIFPGGFGTHDELFEAITLVQTGKSQTVPIVLVDLPEGTYWSRWWDFLQDDVLSRGYISEREMNLFKIVTSADAAVEEITRFYRHFHSYRFVGKDLVIRLNHPPTAALIEQLNTEFSDILAKRQIRQSAYLPEELDDPSTLDLPRLLVRFKREDFARLRQMIDVINTLG
jgi:uncharacterized protein (TIGR00730 family)